MNVSQKIGLVAGPLLFVLTLLFFHPEGLTSEANAILASTIWIAIWWITEAIPISVTASYLQPEPVSTAADLYMQYAQEAQVVPEHSSSASNSPVHSSSAPTGAGPEHTGSAPSTPGESQGRSPAQATSPASSLSSLSSDFSSACLSPTRAEQTSTSPSLDLLTCASPFLHRALYELGVVDTTANNMQLDRESVISIVNGQFAHQLDRTVNV